MKTIATIRLALGLSVLALAARADLVTDWNARALDAIRANRTPPPLAARNLAILHVAIFDACNGIGQNCEPYYVKEKPAGVASKEAAITSAARRVRVNLFPARQADFESAAAVELAALTDGPAKNTGAGEGYFLQPTVIADIPAKSRLEQEEVFGPLLAVIKSKNYSHALEVANDTEFGLTGAVYTQSRDKIDRAIREFHVGNLYINRKCTGATVAAHPFGGFNMSGTDSKSGGPDYLYLFTQGKAVGEKI